MKVLKFSLLLFISLNFWACSNEANTEKSSEEEKEITAKNKEPKKSKKKKSIKELLQGDWVDEEGMDFLSFKGDTVDMAPMGTYSFSIDKETKVISYTPIDENGVAHKNKITKLTNKVLILDPAEDNSGQHAEYSRKK